MSGRGFNETQTTPKGQFDINLFNSRNQIDWSVINLKIEQRFNELCSEVAKLKKSDAENKARISEFRAEIAELKNKNEPRTTHTNEVNTLLTSSALNKFASAVNNAESFKAARDDLSAINEDEKKLMEVVPDRFETNSDGIINLTPANTPAHTQTKKKKTRVTKLSKFALK